MREKEDLTLITGLIENIRIRHELGGRTCLGYADPPDTSVEGELVCPKCGGRLRYNVSSYNGATRGRCDTCGCLHWAE